MVASSIKIHKIQRRFLISFLGAVILVSVIAGLPFSRLRVEKQSAAKLTEIRDKIEVVNNILNGLINMETAVRGYLLEGDIEYLEPYRLGKKQVKDNLPKLDLISNHEKEIETLKRLIAEQTKVSEELIANPGELKIDRQKQLMDLKRLLLARLQAQEESERKALLWQRQVNWASDLIVILVVVSSIVFLLYCIQKWFREIIEAQESLELALAAEHEARIGNERLVASGRDLVSLIAHEIGLPLLHIRLALDVSRTRITPVDENFGKLYALGVAGIARIASIQEEVLELQKSTESSLPIKLEKINLRQWCFDLTSELDIHRIKILVHPHEVLVTDKTLLRRALLNILDNALKYSTKSVVFRCIRHNDSNSMLFVVRDKGLGIPTDFFTEGLWQAFSRAKNVVSIPGDGLGLLTAQKSVERLSGMIAITSQEGVGTEVIVKIPIVS
jgi:signal transduction histidine kinase